MKNVYIGFDSAWAGNQPGASAAIREDSTGLHFIQPRTQDFRSASECFRELSESTNLSIIAIDQPTIVINETSNRPVEKVIAPIISRLGGGVQPANKGKVTMFGLDAPIWGFLKELTSFGYTQSPTERTLHEGKYLIEVYPCLNILGLFPDFYNRPNHKYPNVCGEVARYNPDRRNTFQIDDWKLLCNCVREYGEAQSINGMCEWAENHSRTLNPRTQRPTKAAQDELDAVLCAIMAFEWAKRGRIPERHGGVIGNTTTGYMVTIANDSLLREIRNNTSARGIEYTELW